MFSHHRNAQMFAVGEPLIGGERMRQMKRHDLPVAAHIDGYLDAIEQRNQIAVLPPGIANWMLCSDRAPEIVPGMRVMVKIQQNLETGDRSLAVGHLKFLVDAGTQQDLAHGAHQLTAPELVGMAGRHTDHEEEGSKKAAAHQAVMGCRLIERSPSSISFSDERILDH